MELESSLEYEAPSIATTVQIDVGPSSNIGVTLGKEGKIGLLLNTKAKQIYIKNYLHLIPKRSNEKYWILEEGWGTVYEVKKGIPFWFNKVAKRICLFSDGKNDLSTILNKMIMCYQDQKPERIVNDTIGFIFLLKELRLIKFWREKN